MVKKPGRTKTGDAVNAAADLSAGTKAGESDKSKTTVNEEPKTSGSDKVESETSDEMKIKIFDETIAEVDDLTDGAFAPFWDQPVVRSVLYSTGGLGLGSLLQTLPQFF
jgi:hypothetical protein